MAHYAAHNICADFINGNHGFANTWEISRFATKQERDAFVERYSNKLAKAVSRKEAEYIFRSQYLSVGDQPPAGGLFGKELGGYSRFFNENLVDAE